MAPSEQRCESCGRVGTRGYRTTPAGGTNTRAGYASWPAMTLCTGRTACRRRAYRLTPPEVRAQQRIALEMGM